MIGRLPILAGALALAAVAERGDVVAFHVQDGTVLARTFESRQELSLDEVEMLLNGGPIPTGTHNGMTLIQGKQLELVDRFVAVEGSEPRKLQRTFEKIRASGEQTTKDPMDAGQQEDESRSESELEGKTVVFEWDAAKHAWGKRFEPEGPDEKLLAGLAEGVDFTGFLPRAASVSSGDTWKVEVQAMAELLRPGGDLSLVPVAGPAAEKDGAPALDLKSVLVEALDSLEGEVEATYKGAREIEGVTCGVIGLEFKVHTSRELADKLRAKSAGELQIDRVDAFLGLDGEGELVWDLAGGHARTLSESAKLELKLDYGMRIVSGDRNMDIKYKLQSSGTCSLQAAFQKR